MELSITTIEIVITVISLLALTIAVANFRRSTSPPKINVIFDDSETIQAETTFEGKIKVIQFFIDIVFLNNGGNTGSVMNIYPEIIEPKLLLDKTDERPNGSFWYVMEGKGARTAIEGKVLPGFSMYPINIRFRLFHTSEKEEINSLGTEKNVTIKLNYKTPNMKKKGNLQQLSTTQKIKLNPKKVTTLR